MTPVQKTIAYSAIVVGILGVGMAIGSSIHIAYYVFTSSGIEKLIFCKVCDFYYILLLTGSIYSGCGLTVEGESNQSLLLQKPIYKSLMLTKVGQSEITIQGEGSCNLTLLVVGGGGRGHYGGGGGSGYLEYRSFQVSGSTLMTANVGDQGQSSSLTISGMDTITAQLGENGQSGAGGNGYSGGGGSRQNSGGGDGGSNGGDGEDGFYNGGSGTGQDVSIFTFTTWSLGPGAGGQYYSNGRGGGGGGGLMVNGAEPQDNIYQGAGYGGGGGGNGEAGLQGVILVEIGQ